jgi:acetyl-CoA C-acetyltransferase
MGEAFILAGARTPIGKFLGGLSSLSAPELGAIAIRESLSRADVAPGDVDEVILGNVLQAGLGQAPARQAALQAGLPETVSAVSVNKVCGSSLKAVMLAAQAVRLGDAKILVAGGMESMSNAPHMVRGVRAGQKLGSVSLEDVLLKDGLVCAFGDCHMGNYAEATARKHHISREDQDYYAVQSQHRASVAIAEHFFEEEIVPVTVRQKRSEVTITQDEGPRPETTFDQLSALKPAFEEAGSVTAGNASMLSDGAAAVVVCDARTAERSRNPWKAKIIAYHTAGTAPEDLFVAPVAAIRGVLDRAGLSTDDIDLYEINEAFASQMLACVRELKLDPTKVNIHGGAIALGHPIGASGARVLVTLLSALHHKRLKRGLASLCLGGGNAVAMVVERIET